MKHPLISIVPAYWLSYILSDSTLTCLSNLSWPRSRSAVFTGLEGSWCECWQIPTNSLGRFWRIPFTPSSFLCLSTSIATLAVPDTPSLGVYLHRREYTWMWSSLSLLAPQLIKSRQTSVESLRRIWRSWIEMNWAIRMGQYIKVRCFFVGELEMLIFW